MVRSSNFNLDQSTFIVVKIINCLYFSAIYMINIFKHILLNVLYLWDYYVIHDQSTL